MNRNLIYSSLFHYALIILTGVIVYSGVLTAPFVYDDINYLLNNPAIRDFRFITDLSVLKEMSLVEDLHKNIVLRPLTYFTFAVNYHLHEYNVFGYHAFNIAVHIINALLVYYLVRLTIEIADCSDEDGSGVIKFIPLAVALIFISHPLQIQSVTYIIQRFTSLATLFYLTSLLLYVKSRLIGNNTRRLLCYCGALITTCLAMKTKEIAFTLPVMMVIYETVFLSGTLKQRAIKLVPFLLTMSIIPLATMKLGEHFSRTNAADVEKSLDLVNYVGVSKLDYLLTQFSVITTYIRLLLIPVRQNFDYDFRIYNSFLQAPVALSFLFIIALIGLGLVLLLRARNCQNKSLAFRLRLIGFGIAWFFTALAVESTIVPLDDLIVEQRVYLPSVGLILAVTTSLSLLLEKLLRNAAVAFVAVTLVIIVLLSVMAVARNCIWRDPVALWQDTVSKSPMKGRPYLNLGIHYFMNLQFKKALQALTTSQRLEPGKFETILYTARTCRSLRSFDLAETEYLKAITIQPYDNQPYIELGQLYVRQNKPEAALALYQKLLRFNPEDSGVRKRISELSTTLPAQKK